MSVVQNDSKQYCLHAIVRVGNIVFLHSLRSKSCVVGHVDLEAMYGLANGISGRGGLLY